MALQLGALREALMEAGASEDKASHAAEELASYRLASYEHRLASIENRLRALTWMVAANLALTLVVLAKLLR